MNLKQLKCECNRLRVCNDKHKVGKDREAKIETCFKDSYNSNGYINCLGDLTKRLLDIPNLHCECARLKRCEVAYTTKHGDRDEYLKTCINTNDNPYLICTIPSIMGASGMA